MIRLILISICISFMVFFPIVSIEGEDETLILWFDFEEAANAGADMSDLSGNDYHGTVFGGDVKVTEGVIGEAGVFDGESRVQLDYPALHDPFPENTISVWIKAEDASEIRPIFKEGGSGNGLGIRLKDGNLDFAARSGYNEVRISNPYPDDKGWHFVTAIFDNGEIRLYLDGQKLGSEKTDFPGDEIPTHGSLTGLAGHDDGAGQNPFNEGDSTNFFKGLIDDLRVVRRVLSDGEITAIFLSVTPVEPQGKIAATWGSIKEPAY